LPFVFEHVLHSLQRLRHGVPKIFEPRCDEGGRVLGILLRSAAESTSVIDPRIVESLIMLRTRPRDCTLRHLTTRERAVLAEMATGANNAAIADRLTVTVRAVERHINSIFSKLGLIEEGEAHSRVRAVLLYLADAS
jgi:DNA-binding NarL/FixJ family response regulator